MNNQFLLQNKFAEAYGAGSYQCGQYTEGCSTQTGGSGVGTGDNGGIFAPDTGLFAQPAIVLYPTLLGVAVVIGMITFLISRQVKKLRQK